MARDNHVKASRQLELRVVKELAAIFPVTAIGYERVRADVDQTQRKRAKSGKNFSPVMIGQDWAISQMGKIALRQAQGITPVYVREGWQKDGNGTSQLRTQLGLEKDKTNKSIAKPETHAVDGVALACGYFVKYVQFSGSNSRGYTHRGSVGITPSPFNTSAPLGVDALAEPKRQNYHPSWRSETGKRVRLFPPSIAL
ncbi:hypothetical protein [Coleofasciculus sp. E2-BRE-01]|uniref:hypothetical protein n=1 Tax=Coleofasciculus sp. E2-BRE-01 TaxID=3069524 RepID=UPI0032F0AD6F